MQVLIVDPNKDIIAVIMLHLSKIDDFQVITFDNFETALIQKEFLGDIRLCIARHETTIGFTREKLFELTNDQWRFVILKEDILKIANNKALFNSQKFELQVKENLTALGHSLKSDKRAYHSIPIDLFYHISELSSDAEIYLKVDDPDGEKHVKKLSASAKVNSEDLDKYKKLGVQYLYIPADKYKDFANYLAENLLLQLMLSTPQQKLNIEASTFQLTVERIHSLGIDNVTINAVNETIQSMEQSIENNVELSSYLEKIKLSNSSFSYSHSYLISLFMHKIIGEFSWSNESHKKMLTFIAYFHDIALKSDETIKLSKMKNCKEIASSQSMKVIMDHAFRSASLVGKIPNAPAGTTKIICEHHGYLSGIGIDFQLNPALDPLSKVFMVVEDFAVEYLMNENSSNIEELRKIIAALKLKYNAAVYLDTVLLLEKMINQK